MISKYRWMAAFLALAACEGGSGGEGSDSTGMDMDASSSGNMSTTGAVSDSGTTASATTSDDTSSGSSSGSEGSSSSSGGDGSSSSSSSGGDGSSSSSSSSSGGDAGVALEHYADACIDAEVHPCAGEEDHWIATRLAPEMYPFSVTSFEYGMLESYAGEFHCDSTLAHTVALYIMDADAALPPATPEVLFTADVPAADEAAELGSERTVEVTLDAPLVLEDGQHLVVAIQNAGDVNGPACAASGDATCVSSCAGAGYEADENFWSNGAAAPYAWATLQSFGISQGPNVIVYGDVTSP